MTLLADQAEGVPVRKDWGVELPAGRKNHGTVRTPSTAAAFARAPTMQGCREQEVVYTFHEEMTLKAADAIKMTLNEDEARMGNHTYHVHPHTGTRSILRSRGMTAWRVYHPYRKVCCRATTDRPTHSWRRRGCKRREE